MELATQYFADAVKFEQLASLEADSKAKEHLLKQAAAFRKLGESRAKTLGVLPSDPPTH
jgi:hypothetical protein